MKFLFKSVTDLTEWSRMEDAWNRFASDHSDNPYLLSKFIELPLKSIPQNQTPMFIVGYLDGRIVGIAPLLLSERLGVRIATFAIPPYSSPDFLIEDQFRTVFIDRVLDYLFKTLRSKIADLTFPAESDNVQIVHNLCEKKNIHFNREPYMARRVMAVASTWEQFETMKGGNFRRRFKKMENKLKRTGSCQVTCIDREDGEHEVFNRIIDIDKKSWKEKWRSTKAKETDPDLLITWDGAEYISKIVSGFKRRVWFLELNGHPIAFAIILVHKGTATITKTSYDARYRGFYPGMYLINAALRAIFDNERVTKIDFMTDMAFMEAWTDLREERIRVLMGKGFMPKRAVLLYRNKQVRKKLAMFADRLPFETGSLIG